MMTQSGRPGKSTIKGFSMLSLTGNQITCLMNHQWKGHHHNQPITIDMVKKAISQMKAGKAPGPSGIVVEMITAAGDQ